jgi:hypothetical protein
MDAASAASIDEREAYLILFTKGMNSYVCRNEGAAMETRALFRGTCRECQIWVERRGIAAALLVRKGRIREVPGPSQGEFMVESYLDRLAR